MCLCVSHLLTSFPECKQSSVMTYFNLLHSYSHYELASQKRQRFKVGLGNSKLLELLQTHLHCKWEKQLISFQDRV